MKSLIWAVIASVGFGLMLGSYYGGIQVPDSAPWSGGLLFVGRGRPGPAASDLAAAVMPMATFPRSEEEQQVIAQATKINPDYRPRAPARLMADDAMESHFPPALLAWGRLPSPGTDEILAGCEMPSVEGMPWGGHTLKVVGQLDRTAYIFARAYLLRTDAPAAEFFRPPYEESFKAYIVTVSPEFADKTFYDRLTDAFPAPAFECLHADAGRAPVPLWAYLLYVGGMAFLIVGGVGLLTKLYRALARIRIPLLAEPLQAIADWPRLWWGLHAAFFGVVFLGFAFALAPGTQVVAQEAMHKATVGDSTFQWAINAYKDQNIPLAALGTLVNNYLKCLLVLTISSFVVPFVGALLWAYMFLILGMAMAPTTTQLAHSFIPHSLVLLLESEGYVLAIFLAALLPVYLFRRAEGTTFWQRYWRGVRLNLKGAVLVFAVLALAAVYEAAEVILQLR